MATPISRDDRRAVSCSGLRPSQLTASKTYTTRWDITKFLCAGTNALVVSAPTRRAGSIRPDAKRAAITAEPASLVGWGVFCPSLRTSPPSSQANEGTARTPSLKTESKKSPLGLLLVSRVGASQKPVPAPARSCRLLTPTYPAATLRKGEASQCLRRTGAERRRAACEGCSPVHTQTHCPPAQ